MGSVSSVNPGLKDLFQTMANTSSPLLSSPNVVSALEAAPTADIVQLSREATQLQGVDAMFGLTTSSPDNFITDMNSILANLEAPANSGAAANAAPESAISPQTSSGVMTGQQLASYQAAMQGQETATLLGLGTAGGLSNPIFNLIA